jgi:hypothetical protein
MGSLMNYAALPTMVEHARSSQELRKLAALVEGAARANVLAEKFAHDVAVIQCLEKTGSRLMTSRTASNVSDQLSKLSGGTMGRIGKGLAYGAGAAVPLGIAGHMVASNANQDLRDTTQMGLGALGVGAGVLGIGSLLRGRGDDQQKRAADNSEGAVDAIAAYRVYQKLVKSAAAMGSDEEKAYHAEVAKMAAGHVSDIVADLILE